MSTSSDENISQLLTLFQQHRRTKSSSSNVKGNNCSGVSAIYCWLLRFPMPKIMICVHGKKASLSLKRFCKTTVMHKGSILTSVKVNDALY